MPNKPTAAKSAAPDPKRITAADADQLFKLYLAALAGANDNPEIALKVARRALIYWKSAPTFDA